MSPFADASSVKELTQEVRSERIERLEQEILTVRGLQCHANVQEVKMQYTERLQWLIERYLQINNNQMPRIPGCDEV